MISNIKSLVVILLVILIYKNLNATENYSNNKIYLKNNNLSKTEDFKKKDKHSIRLNQQEKFKKHPKHQNNDWYQDFKNVLSNKYNTEYTFDLTYMPQKVIRNKTKTLNQIVWSPYLSIKPFQNTIIGSGQIQFSYSGVQYWGERPQNLQKKIKVVSGINDYMEISNQFSQLLYTHTLPGSMKWLSLSLGQYSLYSIDGTAEDYNQQTGFISYSLSQNATASYPTSSLGAYLQINPNSEWLMQLGFQDANNINGNRINFKTFDNGKYTTYMYISWNPTFLKRWVGQYMILAYNQPSTPQQIGDSQGLSFSFSQYFGESFNIFGRINTSNGNITPIKQSIITGIGFKDPFKRNPNDYFGIALAFNSINKTLFNQKNIHKYENVIESQYVVGITKYLTITPDIQIFINPALDTKKNIATVISLRFGLTI